MYNLYINIHKTDLSNILNYKLVAFYKNYPFYIRKKLYIEDDDVIFVDVQKENLVSNIHFLKWLNDDKEDFFIYDFISCYDDDIFKSIKISNEMIDFLIIKLCEYIRLYPKYKIDNKRISFILNTEDALSVDMIAIFAFIYYLSTSQYLHNINLKYIGNIILFFLRTSKNRIF
jgi:hypothetical protein